MSAQDHDKERDGESIGEELVRLRNEWRDRMAIDMKTSKDAIERIERHVNQIREGFTRHEQFKDIELRVRGLEEFRAKLFGMFVASQLLGGLIVAVVGWLIKK